MDILSLVPALWKLLENKKVAINVTNLNNTVVISILKSRKIKKRFINTDSGRLIADLTQYLQA